MTMQLKDAAAVARAAPAAAAGAAWFEFIPGGNLVIGSQFS